MDGKITERRCGECGEPELTCPNCGGTFVTPHEHDDSDSPTSISLHRFVRLADDGDQLTLLDVCWECEWEREKTVTVEVH